ncbi:GCN5-related N-acetyltransferase like protein [Gloeothece citriformis PCC 7424]|uniref:GCN5-related N-acetyltransferase like protein n=1 Tax=Gloeothece citriformis (strain PCC 7424) TaxID=65393 RepID=B7KBE5_GLOC7|nr:GNAT family N-acetyltransferase [Gloeothece citriformis]ACK71501.1 GCN5-related N-acetyltransferase like protein [Gloeothece citriformis PCC 7424]
MSISSSQTAKTTIRPLYYRDLEAIKQIAENNLLENQPEGLINFKQELQQVQTWYGLFKVLSWFPNPFRHHLGFYVADSEVTESPNSQIRGVIKVAPFNSSRSTWRVEQVLVKQNSSEPEFFNDPRGIASQLLRYCLEKIWEARTWIIEVNIHEKSILALYRQNGFQPLAELTYWSLCPELLQQLAENEPDLPNLLPVSNADAHLLYQLDCVSMPPLLRQVFDRHPQDFKVNFSLGLANKLKQWSGEREISRGYVFEPQRKAAIGHFELTLSKTGNFPHKAKLTVHPAYTWLYPKLLIQMARISQKYPSVPLELISADYQHERQEYLEKLEAQRVEHTLLMSRSVWHKLKEVKPEGIQLSEVFQGLHPVPRQPIPSPWLKMSHHSSKQSLNEPDKLGSHRSKNGDKLGESLEHGENGKKNFES